NNIYIYTINYNIIISYNYYELLNCKQKTMRYVVNNVFTTLGSNVYIVGNVSELGNWNPDEAIGPMFNQVIYEYPSWYYDISVPANESIEFKFIKKDAVGNVEWESGINHSVTTPHD